MANQDDSFIREVNEELRSDQMRLVWKRFGRILIGAAVLVAPVPEPGATERDVYLPVGATWTDARTGEEFDGGQTVRAAAPLASIPVFARTPEALALLGELAGVAE